MVDVITPDGNDEEGGEKVNKKAGNQKDGEKRDEN